MAHANATLSEGGRLKVARLVADVRVSVIGNRAGAGGGYPQGITRSYRDSRAAPTWFLPSFSTLLSTDFPQDYPQFPRHGRRSFHEIGKELAADTTVNPR